MMPNEKLRLFPERPAHHVMTWNLTTAHEDIRYNQSQRSQGASFCLNTTAKAAAAEQYGTSRTWEDQHTQLLLDLLLLLL